VLIGAHQQYRVSGWAAVGQKTQGSPIWEIVKEYLKENETVSFGVTNQPKIVFN
jgi:sulfur-oxidizing protein SoxB